LRKQKNLKIEIKAMMLTRIKYLQKHLGNLTASPPLGMWHICHIGL